jgi:nitrous oxide reductase accessory protein NosL
VLNATMTAEIAALPLEYTNMARTQSSRWTPSRWTPTYRVIRLKDATFVVEISVQGTCPTTEVRTFTTEAEAEAWIARRQLK